MTTGRTAIVSVERERPVTMHVNPRDMDTQRMPSTYYASKPNMDEYAVAGGVDFEFSFAFQPIINVATREVISFEALVRGPSGEPSAEVFAKVPRENLYRFDQACRVKAIHVAKRLNLQTRLNINLFPNAIHLTGMNIRATLQASFQEGFPVENLIFEVSEAERLIHYSRVVEIFKSYEDFGFQTAIDDFGTGYSGLRMLAEYQPNYIKLDRNIIADIHENYVKQTIVKGIGGICKQLCIEMIAEGVEKVEEYLWLRDAGINIFQGYYFARPAFEALIEVPMRLL
jgi:EAL domain-containing protein (putative c-di-GMP-specific phosphodiesterase class I)